jgi:hypothetical protein
VRRRNLRLLLLGGVAALATLASSADWTPTQAAAPTPVPASVITRHVTGCGLPITVYSPRRPGAALPGAVFGMPDGPHTVLGEANKSHARWLRTVTCEAVRSGPRLDPDTSHGNFTSLNWSGYLDTPSVAVYYVQAYWTVPRVGVPNAPAATNWSSAWVGIGTGVGGELIQIGSEQNAYCKVRAGRCQKTEGTYYFWYQAFPKEKLQRISPT